MRIAQVTISGFRGIKNACVDFGAQNVLVGENGSGKSSIVDAMWLALARSPLARELTEHDFFGSEPGKGDRFRIIVTLTGFGGNDPAAFEEWFRKGRGVPVWWDPKTRLVLAEGIESHHELACQVGFAARFDHETLEVETLHYFHDSDDVEDVFVEDAFGRVPANLLDDIGFFVLPAGRTREHLASFSSYLFRRAVSLRGAVPAARVLAERDRLRAPAEPFEAHGSLKGLVEGMDKRLGSLLPMSPKIRLRLTETDADSVLAAIVPHYAKGESMALPAARHGTGLLSLQALLLLLEIGEARKAEGKSFILAMEEPEMHLPPGIQRRLLFEAQRVASQVLCTTHSPRVAGFYAPTDVRLVQCTGGELKAAALRREPIAAEASNAIRKLFQDSRVLLVEAMMYPSVVVPEGRTDSDWLRLLSDLTETSEALSASAGEKSPPFGAVIGVVPTHDAAVVATFKELFPLHKNVVPLVDGDSAGDGYAKELGVLVNPPAVVLRWRSGWAIEEVVGWLFDAQQSNALERAGESLGRTFLDSAALVASLKVKDSGFKGDLVAYEAIAAALRDDQGCVQRAVSLLVDIADAVRDPSATKFDNVRETVAGLPVVIRLPI